MAELLYLSRADVESVQLPMPAIIEAVEDVFREKALGRTEMPPKPGIHPRPDAFIHAMPAFIPRMRSAGIKWVSGFPENQAKGLPYISGLLVLNDPETGVPQMVSDCTWITAMRTGAASAVAAKHLARRDSTVMGVLGCGVQGRSHLEAMRAALPSITRVLAFDTRREAMDAYRGWAKGRWPDLQIEPVTRPEQAVKGAHVVVSSGPILKHPSPQIENEWFEDGAFACPVDFDSYWKAEALLGCDLFATDDLGQLAYYETQGYFRSIPKMRVDLGDIVAGKAQGRTNDDQRIIAMNLGIALEDMAVAIQVYERARAQGIGTRLPL
jgi:ornithine cyclodeaminase/alanine dehydrogenase